MALKYTVGILSLLSGVTYAAPAPGSLPSRDYYSSSSTAREVAASPGKLQLVPVTNTNKVHTAGRNATPRKNLNLAWQTPGNDSIVSVGLTMQNSAVALENVDDVTAVDCSGNSSIAITFNNTEAFDEALTAWRSLNDSFVMITNHLGDCDSELERSFFVADSDTLAAFASNLTIIAQAEKSDVASTASKDISYYIAVAKEGILNHILGATEIDFTSLASADSVDKRGIHWNSEGLSIAYNFSIPSHQTIINTEYVTVVVNEASVNNSVRYSGHAKWELLHGVTEFYIDIDKSVYHYANLEIGVTGPWSKTWSWSPVGLTYSVLDIPGIISLGPSAGISFGGEIKAAVEGKISGEFTSQMPNGTVHIDFVNWDSSCECALRKALFAFACLTCTLNPTLGYIVA